MKNRIIEWFGLLSAVAVLLAGCRDENATTVTDFPISGELLVSKQYDLSLLPLNADKYLYVSGDVVLVSEWNGDYHWSAHSLSSLSDNSIQGFRAGRKGRGPNEFVNRPTVLVPTPGDGSFVAYDHTVDEFKRFTFEDERLVVKEEKELPIPHNVPVNMLTRINDDTYLCLNDAGNTEFILINPHTGEYKEVVKYPRFMVAQAEASGQEALWVSLTNRPVAKPDGTRFANFYFRYKYFRIFDDNGNVLKEVSVDIEPYTSHEATTEKDPFAFAYDSAFATDEYIYAICSTDDRSNPDEEKPSELQVWNWDGEPIASYPLDHKVVFGYITLPDMKLYSFDYLDNDYSKACLNVHDLSQIPH